LPARARAYSESATAPRGVSNRTSTRAGNALSALQSDSTLPAMSSGRASSTTRSRSLDAVAVGCPVASSKPTLPAGPHSFANPFSAMILSTGSRTARAGISRCRKAAAAAARAQFRAETNLCGVTYSRASSGESQAARRSWRDAPRTPTGTSPHCSCARRMTTHGVRRIDSAAQVGSSEPGALRRACGPRMRTNV